jgi:hypothetical protein
MFRKLKRDEQILQQFEIIEKENSDPRSTTGKSKEDKAAIPAEREILENAFDALMVILVFFAFCESCSLS